MCTQAGKSKCTRLNRRTQEILLGKLAANEKALSPEPSRSKAAALRDNDSFLVGYPRIVRVFFLPQLKPMISFTKAV